MEDGRGEICLLPLPSFILWSAYWALPPRSAAKDDGGCYNNIALKLPIIKVLKKQTQTKFICTHVGADIT
jgi:hypothetical protein